MDKFLPHIDLRSIFKASLFYFISSSAEDPAILDSFTFETGLLRMELKRSGGRSGTIWVDAGAKRLVRAVENGQQVFP